MEFSEQVWEETLSVYKAIIHHPFNQELMYGTLDTARFGYYIEQDALYLTDFARSLALIATRASHGHMTAAFLKFSQGSLLAEQEVVHQFFRQTFNLKECGQITRATLMYTNFLLRMCALEPFEIAVAAVLPCFWIYREVGRYILKGTVPHNPFEQWITTYASDEFSTDVEEMIEIFDCLAEESSVETKRQMSKAFQTSVVLEWHFWNDAYVLDVFRGEY
jgi:thiaminase/transcriptional activator TenA